MEKEDWERENRAHKYKLDDGSNFLSSERLPAKIIIKIKLDTNDNQTNKRTLSGISKERLES